jgi:hypothetical protein
LPADCISLSVWTEIGSPVDVAGAAAVVPGVATVGETVVRMDGAGATDDGETDE